MRKKIASYFLLLPLFSYVISILFLIFDYHLTFIPLLISSIISLVIIFHNSNLKVIIPASILIILIQFVSILISSLLFDASYDGQVYHTAIIKELASGWNPFHNPIISPSDLPFDVNPDIAIWVSHYPKGMETVEASIVALTNNLESGKAFNIWLFLSMLFFTWEFFGNFSQIKNRSLRLMLTLIVVANPVVLDQIFTYYIDFSCYSFITIGIILYYQLICSGKDKFINLLSLGLVCFFVPSIKFNIAFWFVIILGGGAIVIYFIKGKVQKKIIGISALIFAGGIFIGGYNPYVTNLIQKGNPLYPLVGKDKIDIVTSQIPASISNNNRFVQVNKSLISNPQKEMRAAWNGNPFLINKEAILASGMCDVRVGGFGIFFFEATILLLILYLFQKKTRNWWIISFSLIFLYVLLFILPGGFWARYTCFFYLCPCIMISYICICNKFKWVRYLSYFASFLLLINGFISFTNASYLSLIQTLKTNYLLHVIELNNEKNINISSQSFTLLEKMSKFDNVKFTPSDFNEPFFILSVYPSARISPLKELRSNDHTPFLLKRLGYNNIVKEVKD